MFSGCSIEGLMAVRPLDKEDDMGLNILFFSCLSYVFPPHRDLFVIKI